MWRFRNKTVAFIQKQHSTSIHGPWYDAQVVGVNTFGSMMKNISIDADLGELYTNHCIRATSVTILGQSGFETRHIMSLSGH